MSKVQHPTGFGRTHKRPVSAIAVRHGISPLLVYPLFALLVAVNVVTAVGFLMSPEIARLLSGQNDAVLGAYEERISQLRIEVDRLHSRQYAQAGDLNLQLQDLAQQQDILAEQHQYVRALAEKAAELGIDTASSSVPIPATRPAALITGAVDPAASSEMPDIDAAAQAVSDMIIETRGALTAISTAAEQSTAEIVDELGEIGIQLTLPQGQLGVGGPFVPAEEGPVADVSLLDDANAVYNALVRFQAARLAIDGAPVHAPIAEAARMSSNFGNRRDPFNGRLAFHAGIDFAMPSGTNVLAAGAGRISFAGQRSGYGNVVEITHESGLVTRYAHLSRILVNEGQVVDTGMPIGKVGSTGRSTGPHLHFEVRRGDSPLNPAAFIEAGRRLQRFLDV